MLLTITTTRRPATDLGYLLHKNPARCQKIQLSFGDAFVFYPEASEESSTVALLLDVDPIGLVRGKTPRPSTMPLEQYVNDRPYVCSSFLSVALGEAFGTAMGGRCAARPDLPTQPMPLTARLSCLPCRGGEKLLRALFEPLGYEVRVERSVLDPAFPQWGDSPYFTVELCKEGTLRELLNHLYVLVPVLDGQKHYYIGSAEMEKLLRHGEGWLGAHPERETIARRYLKHVMSYARQALARLSEADPVSEVEADAAEPKGTAEDPPALREERLGTVLALLKQSGARRVLDLGCGEGHLLRLLMKEKQFERIVGLDVSLRALEIAAARLKVAHLPDSQRGRLDLLHGSLMYRDRRLEGFDAAAVMEVVEHLAPERLAAFERVLFECARPSCVVVTTPNREYNVRWEGMASGRLRHPDHYFEWTREEFQQWAMGLSARFGYDVRFLPIGPVDEILGPPTQAAFFDRRETSGPVGEI